MNIIIGADHYGYPLKDILVSHLKEKANSVLDIGTNSADEVAFPDFAVPVAERTASGEFDRGILVCGTGQGMAIAANKVTGVRAALCNDIYTAKMSRLYNNANVLTLGSDIVGPGMARDILDIWLETDYPGEVDHWLAKLDELDGS